MTIRNKVYRVGWLGSILCSLSTLAIAIDDGSQMNDPFRVNYAGYLPQAEKIGIYLAENSGPIEWTLVGSDCSGTEDTYVANDKSSGDSFYLIDFSECTVPSANVSLSVGGSASATFDISDDPYGDLKYEFFDYFKDHEGSATFNQSKNNWGDMNVSFNYVKDAGDNGAYPTNTAEAAWALINMLETYPAINTYYSSNFGSRTVYDQLAILTEQFQFVLDPTSGLAVPKFHTNVNSSWASCAPYSSGSCISEPETKATYATARTLAAMARLHLSYGTVVEANAAFDLAETAYNNAKSNPFTCNQSDAFGGEGGMYPDNDNTSLWRNPKTDRDNCIADKNNTEDDEYAAIVELYIAAQILGDTSKAASYQTLVTSHSRFNEASSYWWGAVVMEANLSLLSNEMLHTIDMSAFKINLKLKANEIYAQSAKGYPGVTWDPESDQWDAGDDDHIDNNVRWGSHRMALNDARVLMAAAEVSAGADAARFARGAVKVLDHISGVNAINLAMFTAAGYGDIENAVTRTHDGANASDSWAGKMVLGPNNWTNADDGAMPTYGSQPGLKMFALTGTGWSSREVSIDANAALVPVAFFADQIAPQHFMKDPIGNSAATSIPSAPTALSVSNSTASSLSINWNDTAGANDDAEQGFRIYASTGSTHPVSPVLTTSANSTTAVVTGLSPSTNYTLWLEAYNALGTSTSVQVSGTTEEQSAFLNIIDNGDFSSGTAAWLCEQPGGFATCSTATGQYQIAISDGGTLTWHIQPQQGGLSLIAGQTYTFAFDAKASGNRVAEIKIERPASPWEDFTQIGTGQSLTTTMQRFDYTFTMPATVDARMVMNVGANNNDVTIDNVWLVEGTSDPCNGIVGCDADVPPEDSDGDGVIDSEDDCPFLAGPSSNKGCPVDVDTDGDGVADTDDACPLISGPASNSGCPIEIDTDNDGVLDSSDECPSVAGPASNNGCPVAAGGLTCNVEYANDWGTGAQLNTTISNNGTSAVQSWSFPMTFDNSVVITNYWNANISGSGMQFEVSNGDWNGSISANGNATFGFQISYSGTRPSVECGTTSTPVDSDNDGVIDAEDSCPNEAGPASNNGCPVVDDSDGDGVADSADLCPNTPVGTPVDASGCEQTLGYTAAQANALMGKGFNLGQMFENTDQPIDFNSSKAKIDAYYALGFSNVRIPITWTERHHGDYLADPDTGVVNRNNTRLKTIEDIVDYALSLNLFVVINMHHEFAVKEQGKTDVVAQVWADASDIFKDRDNRLMFEILNEPHKANGAMAAATVRELTTKAYNKIREVSTDRIVIIGGNQWFAAAELAAVWPSLEGVGSGNDPYVMATFHHYDPWDLFHFEDTWPKDYAFDDGTVAGPMEQAQNWANSVGGIPLYIGEWGVGWGKLGSSMTCNNIRHWYTTFGATSTEKEISTSVWDDGGWFKIFDIGSKTFNNNLAQCIGGDCDWDADYTRNNAGCYL